jgi:PAS domain S-box-containing protein
VNDSIVSPSEILDKTTVTLEKETMGFDAAQAIEYIKDYAILMLDPAGKVLTWNEGAKSIKGYKASEIIGKNMSVFYTAEDQARHHPEEILKRTAKEGRLEDEGWRVRKNGSLFWADVIITALKNKNGKLRGFIKVTRDISEIKKAQKDLQDKTELFDLVLKNMNDGVVVADEKGEIQVFNPAAQKISGGSVEKVKAGLRLKHVGVFLPDGVTPFPESDNPRRKAVEGEETNNVEMLVKNANHPDGLSLFASGRPLRDEKGNNRGGVVILRDITEIKKAQKELQKKTELLNSVLKNMNDGVVAMDENGQYFLFNPAAEKMLGKMPKGIQRGTIMKGFGVFHSDGVTPFSENESVLAKAIQGEATNDVEMFVRNPNHQQGILLNVSGRPLLDERGGNQGGVAIFRDVTEIKKIQRELQEKTEGVDEIKDYAIVMLDQIGKIITWNAGAKEIYGYQAFEIIGENISTFFTPVDRAKGYSEELLRIAVAEGRVEDEGWRVRKDGSRFMDNVVITALKDEKGELRGFIKVTRDVTEIKKNQRELEEKSELLNSVLENISDGVAVANEKGEFLVFNPAAQNITGRVAGSANVGEWSKHFGVFRTDGVTPFPDVENPLARAMRGEETNDVELFLRNPVHPEGVIVSASGRPLKDKKGHGVAIFRDLTEQKRQEKMKIYTKALETSNRDLQDFIFVASHDLQEPLRKIESFGNFLMEEAGPALTSTTAGYLSRIQDAAKRMSVLIDDLLQLTRITTKAKPFEPVDLFEIIKEVRSDLEAKLIETGGKIELGELPKVEADPAQMRQLFQNLISNALKYHKPNVPPLVKLEGETDISAGLCRIRVIDNGIGFHQKYAGKIFNIFQRLHDKEEYEGTGIGLAICKKVVERHGGTITATSQLGSGALFEITLPIHQLK